MRWLIGDNNFDALAGWVEKLIDLSPDTLAHLLDTIITSVVDLLLRR